MAPTNLRKGLFRISALDNIDHNLSSTTATTSSFHGTAISIHQIRAYEDEGEPRSSIKMQATTTFIVGGPCIVNALRPDASLVTFEDYSRNMILSYITKKHESYDRVDIVWDTYVENSLNFATRQKRGKGKRLKVSSKVKVPSNWPEFLKVDDNKQEPFNFLSSDLVQANFCENGKQFFITKGENVLHLGIEVFASCDHEEADTRILYHILDSCKKLKDKIQVKTVDTVTFPN